MNCLATIIIQLLEKTPEDIIASWTRTTEKLYELLQWAHSEGLADLATMNGFIETMADQTELFKSVKSDVEQQKQVWWYGYLMWVLISVLIFSLPKVLVHAFEGLCL